MLRTILWIAGIGAALAGLYFAYQKWVDQKKKDRIKAWAKKQQMKAAKLKIKKGQVKESEPQTYGCPSCQGRSTDRKTCSNCKQEINYN